MFKVGDKVRFIKKHLGFQPFEEVIKFNGGNVVFINDIKEGVYYCHTKLTNRTIFCWWFSEDELIPYNSSEILKDFYLTLCLK